MWQCNYGRIDNYNGSESYSGNSRLCRRGNGVLPVSSTGHMIIVGHMLGFDGPAADIFDVFVQLGAILSVIFIYKERFARFLQKKAGRLIKG